MLDFVSWTAVVLVLLAYSQVTRRPVLFDWANVILFVPVALPAILAGAYSSASISVAFGFIAIYNLTKREKDGTTD